jgi:glycosyltransferase involved in cell wall biosynthesis
VKIAYYSSSREDIPHDPKTVAANSDVMLNIIDSLKNDHEIFLYASTGSSVDGVTKIDLGLKAHGLDSAYNKEDWLKNVYTAYILRYLTEMAARSGEYDLIHLHVGKLYMGMPFARVSKCPVVLTIHQQLDPHEGEILKSFPGAYLVSISDNQRTRIPSLDYFATAYNGINVDEFTFSAAGGDHCVFRSRISPEKGVEDAITAVKQAEKELDIYGPGDEKYLADAIKPNTNDKIRYNGIVGKGEPEWTESYQKAKVLIMPIQWDEPFGLVMAEAMACGTPVIAYSRGSVPEVIKDGVTGFIVNPDSENAKNEYAIKNTGVEGLVEAIEKIYSMEDSEYKKMRENCRKHVEENFTVQKMSENYIEVYKRAIDDFKTRQKTP